MQVSGLWIRSFAMFFLPPVMTLAALVAAVHVIDRTAEWRVRRGEASGLVDLQRATLLGEFRSIESDALFLAQQQKLVDFAAGDTSARDAIEREYVHFCAAKRRYDQIRYLDIEGVERIRVNFADGVPVVVPESELQTKAGRYYVDAALEIDRGVVYVSRFDLNVEYGVIEEPRKPVIRFATPVFDAKGTKRGILVLNYLGARLLGHVADLATNFAGQSMLVDGEGYWLVGPSPDDEWGFALGSERRFSGDYTAAWQRIANEQRGSVTTAEGIFAFETIDSENPLHFVAHVPRRDVARRPARVLQRLLLVYGVMVALVATLATFLARASILRSEQDAKIRDSEARLRALTTRLLDAQETERRAIARDLHDDLGQLVTATSLDLQRAQAETSEDRRSAAIGHALASTEMLLERVHEIATRLRPTVLDDFGLRDALQSLAAEFESARGVSVRTALGERGLDLPTETSQNLFRIVQEALTNVTRHAEANEVEIELAVNADRVELRIADDGRGFDPTTVDQGRLGVLGMRERAELLGGTFEMTSSPGKGTRIEVTVPRPRDVENGKPGTAARTNE